MRAALVVLALTTPAYGCAVAPGIDIDSTGFGQSEIAGILSSGWAVKRDETISLELLDHLKGGEGATAMSAAAARQRAVAMGMTCDPVSSTGFACTYSGKIRFRRAAIWRGSPISQPIGPWNEDTLTVRLSFDDRDGPVFSISHDVFSAEFEEK